MTDMESNATLKVIVQNQQNMMSNKISFQVL